MSYIMKRILVVAGALFLALVILLVSVSCSAVKSKGSEKAIKPEITEEEAKTAALEKCKVKAEDATITQRKLSSKSGKPVYTIVFMTEKGNDVVTYTCRVDGLTGKAGSVRKTTTSKAESNKDEQAEDIDEYSDPDNFIGVGKVKSLILSDAGLEDEDVTFTSVRLQNKGEKIVYVAEFESNEIRYKFKVDAVTGAVIERKVQYDE